MLTRIIGFILRRAIVVIMALFAALTTATVLIIIGLLWLILPSQDIAERGINSWFNKLEDFISAIKSDMKFVSWTKDDPNYKWGLNYKPTLRRNHESS